MGISKCPLSKADERNWRGARLRATANVACRTGSRRSDCEWDGNVWRLIVTIAKTCCSIFTSIG